VPPDGPDCVPPSPPATFTTLITTPVCDGDVPKLTYQVAVTGTTSNTVTITWVNPNGDDVVMTGLPLSGTVLWPGAIELNGEPVDWPGWSFVDGPDADSVPDQWVEGDEFDWVRPSVTIIISVNPEASMSVAYPPSSPDCATEPEGAVRGVTGPGITPPPTDGLGAEVRPASGFGLPLILLGLAAVVLAIGFVVPMPATERRRIDEDR
jgi:hypothetical protein